MQPLPLTSLTTGALVLTRDRRWHVARLEREASSPDGPVVVDLAPVRDAAGARLRLLAPPDRLVSQPSRWRSCRPRAWARRLPSTARAPGDDLFDAAARANVQALAYQWVPAAALLSGRVRRVLLADAVGMGKTVQAALLLAEVQYRMAEARSLVVVPAGLVGQWRDELRQRVAIEPSVFDGASLAGRMTAEPETAIVGPGEVCLISLDLLRQPEITALVVRQPWQLVVVDEAHLLAPGTARAAAVRRVSAVASQLLLLTATPFSGLHEVDGHLLTIGRRVADERILVLARQARTHARPPLRQRLTRLRVAGPEGRLQAGLAVYVARAAADWKRLPNHDMAAGQLAAVLLQRRACSSLRAFTRSVVRRLEMLTAHRGAMPADQQPTLTGLDLPGTDDEDDRWLAVPAWRNAVDERSHLLGLAEAAAGCEGPGAKVQWLVRWLRRVGEPVLIFTDYLDTLRALREVLPRHRRATVLHGAQTPAQRSLAIEAFTRGDADVLLATDAASEGLNLHDRCRLVVHVDVPWSPRRLAQRNGRVDRFGQAREVRSRLLALHDTYDEVVLARLMTRAEYLARSTAAGHAAVATQASQRRGRLAAATMSASLAAARPGSIVRHDARVGCRLDRRRWRRLMTRLGLRCDDSLAIVELEASTPHPMARARRWLALAIAPGSSLDCDAVSSDLTEVRRFVARAEARSTRWLRLAQDAAAAVPRPAIADLFADALEMPRPSSPAAAMPSVTVARWRRILRLSCRG